MPARPRARDATARVLALIARLPGQRLPAERDLAVQLGLGRPRLRRLLAELEGRRLIERRQGSGTWVVDPARQPPTRIVVLIDERLRLGQDPFFAACVDHLQRAVQAHAAACEVLRLGAEPPPPGGPAVLLGACTGGGLASWPADRPAVAWFVEADLPARGRISRIALEETAAGAQAARWLIEAGATALCFVGHEDRPSPRARLAGARAAAAAHGLEVALVACGMNYADGVAIAAQLPQGEQAGIIAANDWLAAGIHAAAPGARRLIGFDGLPIATSLGLPSLAMPLAVIADDIVGELARLVGPPPGIPRTLLYPMSLTGAPAAPALPSPRASR